MHSIFETVKFSYVYVAKMTIIEVSFYKSRLVRFNELIIHRTTLEGAFYLGIVFFLQNLYNKLN